MNILKEEFKNRHYPTLSMALMFGWILAMPFEGLVYHELLVKQKQPGNNIFFITVFFHFLALFFCGFIVKSGKAAKAIFLSGATLCIMCSFVFFGTYSELWPVLLTLLSFTSGCIAACWGYWYKTIPREKRFPAIANILILSNIFMIIINYFTELISPEFGLLLSIILLAFDIPLIAKLKVHNTEKAVSAVVHTTAGILKPMLSLCIFVLLLTINSGLMYQNINPSFSNYPLLVSWFWALPYIITIFVLKNFTRFISRNSTLLISMALIGIAFVLFTVLDSSALSFTIIYTLLLSALGVCDLFWWSVLGELLNFTKYPIMIFGMGISANILGILLGKIIGNSISNVTIMSPYALAIIIVFICIAIMPFLYGNLNKLIKNNAFIRDASKSTTEINRDASSSEVIIPDSFSDREKAIINKLIDGYTYKNIAAELFISENTVKYHVKNIYSKLDIHSRDCLVDRFKSKF